MRHCMRTSAHEAVRSLRTAWAERVAETRKPVVREIEVSKWKGVEPTSVFTMSSEKRSNRAARSSKCCHYLGDSSQKEEKKQKVGS